MTTLLAGAAAAITITTLNAGSAQADRAVNTLPDNFWCGVAATNYNNAEPGKRQRYYCEGNVLYERTM